jgi:hypothetical protein
MAADFERAALEHLPADGPHLATRGGRAGESDLVDAGVAHDVLADLAAGRKDRHHALRQPDLVEHLAEQVAVERGLGRRLEDHG